MNDKITLHKDTNLFGVDLKAGEYVRKKEWVGLTDREKKKLIKEHVGHDCTVMPNEFIEVIEAKLKEKNT